MRTRFGFVSDDAPALSLGGIDFAAPGAQAGAVASFNVLSYTPTLSLKGNTNLYTDASQASPVAAFGDQVQQWRDEREVAGQNNYPYGAQSTAAQRPTNAPTAFNLGGVQFTSQRLVLNGLANVNVNNCTVAVVGCLLTDYTDTGAAYVNVGGTNPGLTLFLVGLNTDLKGQPDAFYDNADHFCTSIDLAVGPFSVATIQSTPAGSVVVDVNGVDQGAFTQAGSNVVSNGYVGDWAGLNDACNRVFLARVLVWSPALSGANLAAVQSGLLGEAALNSLYPTSYPLLAFWGNSITVGVGHGGISQAQSYPYQLMNALSVSVGFLLCAVSGKATDQLDTAFSAAIDSHYKAAGRTGAQVWLGMEIHNAIVGEGKTGAQAYADYKAVAQARKTKGWHVLAYTVMNDSNNTAQQNTDFGTANADLRADFTAATSKPHVLGPAGGNTYGDYLLDVQADPRLQAPADTTFFADGTHPTARGYQVIAGYAQSGLALLGVTADWAPSQDASVVALYTADTAIYKDNGVTAPADGDTVQLWKDQTANHRDLSQAAAGNRPVFKANVVNGQPVVRFARGSSQWLASAAFTLAQPLTVFVVAKFADTTQSYLIDGITVNQVVLTNSNATQVRMYAGAGVDTTFTYTNFALYKCTFNGASSSFSANASIPAVNNPATHGLNGLTLRAQGDHAGTFLSGDVAAVLLSNSATPDERLLNWLNNKYALF